MYEKTILTISVITKCLDIDSRKPVKMIREMCFSWDSTCVA